MLPFLRKRARTRNYGEVDEVIGAFITPVQSAWCAARTLAIEPDAVLADTIFRAPLLREPGLHQLNSVIIAHDLFYRRHQTMPAAGYRVYPSDLPRETEAELLSLAKAIAAVQPDEAAEIRLMCQGRRVCVTAMPALPRPPPAGQRKLKGLLVFVGGATLPNIDGLRWFFAEAWPRLRSLSPGVTLDLVGDCGTAMGRLPAGITRLGRVIDLSAILHRSMLAIAPLRVSSGLKIKILDYARHGLVTVATPESLVGLAADPDAPFIAAPDGQAFVEAIMAKLAKTEPAGQQHALDYVTRHYNSDESFSGLADLLEIPGQ